MLSFFPRDVLDEILNLIESVSEGFPPYTSKSSVILFKKWLHNTSSIYFRLWVFGLVEASDRKKYNCTICCLFIVYFTTSGMRNSNSGCLIRDQFNSVWGYFRKWRQVIRKVGRVVQIFFVFSSDSEN